MRKTLKNLLSLSGFAAIFVWPITVFAHVKWFVPVEDIIAKEELGFSIYDPVVLAWLGVILALVLIAYFLEKRLKAPAILTRFGTKSKKFVQRAFQFILGVFFLICAYEGNIIAPIFPVTDLYTEILRWMKVVLGIMLIFDVFVWYGSFLLMLLGLFASIKWGFVEIFDHLHLLGTAIYLFVVKHPKKAFVKEFKDWALPVLRVLAGTSLVVLAFSEKLLHPELGLEFLKQHDWNFVASTGAFDWFTNYVFVMSAGATELLIGIVMILGLLTRINTIVLAVFMLATAIVLGPHEVLGHLPIFALAILLIVYGSGKKLKIVRD